MSTTTASSSVTAIDLTNGDINPHASTNAAFSDSVSSMLDDPTGGTNKVKTCVHLSYSANGTPVSSYHTSDESASPGPRYLFNRWLGFPYGQHLPPSAEEIHAVDWIPVTGRTTNDISDCVSNAFNQFVNGARALDASQSIAEIGETPQLFAIWQRRKGLPVNLVNGFLNYSFGWRPVISDLRAIAAELRSFRKTLRKRLKDLARKQVVKHYRFQLDDTVDSLEVVHGRGQDAPYEWGKYDRFTTTGDKRRVVVVTIRANVKPKLTGEGQSILENLASLGLIPSLATLWSITRLSFVVDWFYNIGGAIENLQGSLTQNISNVSVCVSDSRTRELKFYREDVSGRAVHAMTEKQKVYSRFPTTVPILPVLRYPRASMQYVLLGLLALTTNKSGAKLLNSIDRYDKLSPKIADKVAKALNKLRKRDLNSIRKVTTPGGTYNPGYVTSN